MAQNDPAHPCDSSTHDQPGLSKLQVIAKDYACAMIIAKLDASLVGVNAAAKTMAEELLNMTGDA